MDIDYLYSIFDLYLNKEKTNKKINFSMTKKEDVIEFNFNMNIDDVEATNFSLPYDIVAPQIENILNIYKDNLMIIDEKYNYQNNNCYYYVLFQNGRTLSLDGFSMLELNNIRNILYNISINKEELRINNINEDKQMVYKPKPRLQQAGFTSFVTLFLALLFIADVVVIGLWIFKVISK